MPIYGMTVEPLLIEQSGGFRYAWVITPEIKVLRYQWRSGLSNMFTKKNWREYLCIPWAIVAQILLIKIRTVFALQRNLGYATPICLIGESCIVLDNCLKTGAWLNFLD